MFVAFWKNGGSSFVNAINRIVRAVGTFVINRAISSNAATPLPSSICTGRTPFRRSKCLVFDPLPLVRLSHSIIVRANDEDGKAGIRADLFRNDVRRPAVDLQIRRPTNNYTER